MNIIQGSKYLNKLTFQYSRFKKWFLKRSAVEIFDSSDEGKATKISKIFAINLDRQSKRWKRLVRETRAQKTVNGKSLQDFLTRISAVDARSIKIDNYHSSEVEKLYRLKEHFFIDPDPRLSHLVRSKEIKISMSSAEVAIALSHIKVWKKIVTQEISYSLILEDDIFFEPNFSELANKAWSELPTRVNGKKSFDLLYFSFREVDNKADKKLYSDCLFEPIRGFWWLSGYVLSYEGACKLLDLLPVCGPVDMWMNLYFQSFEVYSLSSSIISQRRDWTSNNSYSIMPILSRIGIHLEEKSVNPKNIITRRPIFAIGLNKTGTTSLHFALTLLGYKCCHWISEKFSDETENLIDKKQPLPFDAYTDVDSIIRKFKELDIQYPNAGFILTTRNLDDWIASRSRHVIRNRVENIKGASHNWTETDVQTWIEERTTHHKTVQDYFKQKKNKLLVIDICGGEGWEPLCKFLELPIPNAPFPKVDPLIKSQSLGRSLIHRIPINSRKSIALEHDNHPWIKKPKNIQNYCGKADEIKGFGNRTGSFSPEITENFNSISPIVWELLNNSFPYNLVRFNPENVKTTEKGEMKIILRNEKLDGRNLTSGGIRSKRKFQYGRFETEMIPTKADGIISAFFLYRIDPWQEIDIEFLGNDTSKILTNVYYNHGEEGTVQNYGTSGTPVLIELGFDASLEFHHYAIEWDPNEIRWFVDDDLVHLRKTDSPTPIPSLPMNVYINSWVPGNSKLAGKINYLTLPKSMQIRSIVLSSWHEMEFVNL